MTVKTDWFSVAGDDGDAILSLSTLSLLLAFSTRRHRCPVPQISFICRFRFTEPAGNKKAMLSQEEPRDAAVYFDTYRILQ